MAMNLLAHILRGPIPDDALEEPAPGRSLGPRRWAFRDLVVRRDDLAAWSLPHPPSANDPQGERSEPGAEPPWPETQPGWHE